MNNLLFGHTSFGGASKRRQVAGEVALSPQSVTQGGIGFFVDMGISSGNYVDGPAWILVSGTAQMSEPTPVQALDGASVVNGAQLNPPLSASQGYDARSTGFAPYSSAMTHS